MKNKLLIGLVIIGTLAVFLGFIIAENTFSSLGEVIEIMGLFIQLTGVITFYAE